MRWHSIVLLGCSWVLWQVTLDVTGSTTYRVVTAEETKAACEATLNQRQQWWVSWHKQPNYQPGDPIILKDTNGKVHALMNFQCLPDTVDPRSK